MASTAPTLPAPAVPPLVGQRQVEPQVRGARPPRVLPVRGETRRGERRQEGPPREVLRVIPEEQRVPGEAQAVALPPPRVCSLQARLGLMWWTTTIVSRRQPRPRQLHALCTLKTTRAS